MPRKKLIFSFTVAAVLLAIVACTSVATEQSQVPAFPTENPHLDIERVPLEEAKAAFDSGAAVFVDVRSGASYAQSHIPGALSIPADVLEGRMDELDPGQWIITYCT